MFFYCDEPPPGDSHNPSLYNSLVPRDINDAALLAHIRKLPHGRASYKQLIKELRVSGDDRAKLDTSLDRLAGLGEIVEIRSDHFIAVAENSEYVTGKLTLHRDGYGFLIPDRPLEGIAGDVFLPPKEAEKGMHGDRVLAHISRQSREGRAEGEIVRILHRAHTTVVGEFRVKRRGNFVIPSDERIQQWIEIPEGLEIPRGHTSRDRVGASAPDAKSVEDLDGMIVNTEILEFPENGEGPVGRVIEILGYPDDFGIDVEIVIRKHHLPHEFPPEATEQAQRISHEIPPDEMTGRRDFRSL